MARWGVIASLAILLGLVASQLVIPPLGEAAIEERLTEGGGSAEVSLSALPALRLLLSDGERIEVEARDLALELERPTGALDDLDGFREVEISVEDSSAGPFELDGFVLSRDGADPYRLVSSGRTTASALTDYGLDSLGLPGAGLADDLFDRLLGESGQSVPVELDMELTSDEGRIRVVSGGGSIAGIETGPLAELITSAIVVRL